jgi:hypothetical protein
MKVKDVIFALQQLDPELDLLVEAADGGLAYATTSIQVAAWEEDVDEPQPIALIGIEK